MDFLEAHRFAVGVLSGALATGAVGWVLFVIAERRRSRLVHVTGAAALQLVKELREEQDIAFREHAEGVRRTREALGRPAWRFRT